MNTNNKQPATHEAAVMAKDWWDSINPIAAARLMEKHLTTEEAAYPMPYSSIIKMYEAEKQTESKPISQQLKEIWDLKSNTRSGVDYGKSFEKLKEDLAKIPELTKRYNENYALGYLTASVRKHLEVCTIEMVEEKESSEVLFLDGTLGPKDDDTFDPPENDVPEELFRSPAAPEGNVSDNSLLHY